MTAAGRLARGKANFDSQIFLNNSETIDYIASMKVKKEVISKVKPKEKEDDKSSK